MTRAILAVYGGLVVLVGVKSNQYLTLFEKWPFCASLLSSMCIGGLLLLLYDVILNSKKIKRMLSPMSQVEGEWCIDISNLPERPNSICKIYMNDHGYIYTGFASSTYFASLDKGFLAAEWVSRSVSFDKKREEMSFVSDAVIVENSKRIRNYGYIKFIKNAGKYDYGSGYFVDISDDSATQHHMTLRKISSSEFDKYFNSFFVKACGKQVKLKDIQKEFACSTEDEDDH